MSPRALWHRGIRCVLGLFVGFQHSSVQKNAIKTSSHKQRMRLILQNVHSLAYTSERSLWILEEKQLLTVIGLEIWNKLLVIGNLSCQRGKDRILKYSSSNYHPGKFPTFPRVPCGRGHGHAALKISKMFDEILPSAIQISWSWLRSWKSSARTIFNGIFKTNISCFLPTCKCTLTFWHCTLSKQTIYTQYHSAFFKTSHKYW